MDVYVCMHVFPCLFAFILCVYILFHCYVYLQLVTSLTSRLAFLVACHFIVELFSFSLSVYLSVCLSVTRRYSIKTAKPVVKLFHRRVATPF